MASTQVRATQIANEITDTDVAAANKDGAAGTASMRTLGTGATQAAAGNHTHAHSALTGLTSGDDHTQYVYGNGRAGGQTVYGGTASGDGLILAGGTGTNPHVSLLGSISFSERTSPAQITADQNDYNPAGLQSVFVLRLNTNAARNITGLTAPTGLIDGRLLMIQNTGSFTITLKHESISSVAANRFHFSSAADVVIQPDANLLLYYDNQTGVTRWKELAGNSISHSMLTGLTGDDHTQYALLGGRAGNQTLFGGTATHESLTLRGSSFGDGRVIVGEGLALNRTTIGGFAADQNDYVLAATSNPVLRMSSTTAVRTITGIDPTNHSGCIYYIVNVGTTLDLILAHENAGSTAANRFNFANQRDYVLRPGGSVQVWYDGTSTRWRPMHEPGSSRALPPLFRQGLTWKRNATDTTNDVDVAVGCCRDSTDTYDIYITSALTKQLDVAWAVGNNAGGLDTGTRAAATWYYIWAIARSDTGVCDILLSVSNSAPTMPTNYDKKRLIGAIKTGFSLLDQVNVRSIGGDLFVQYLDPASIGLSANVGTLSTARSNFTLAVPLMPNTLDFTLVKCNVMISNAAVGTQVWFYTPDVTDAAPSNVGTPGSALVNLVANQWTCGLFELPVDKSAQVSARASAASTSLKIQVLGYYWPGYL